ncbi:hypothetical protein D1007_13026 [Hordeum vulgare]|nr:hypothetical protein D1007_13026 [Hordeum vulgare]
MAWLARRLLLCLSLLGTLSAPGSTAVAMGGIGQLRSRGTSIGVSRPQPDVNFTIGVIGAVWCKHCRYAGYLPSKNVAPLPNAAALLRCRRGRQAMSAWGATDARGYFMIETAEQAVPFASKDCVVYVPRSPRRGACGVAVLPRRNQGSPLRFREYVTRPDGLQALYTAGNFVFGPRDPAKCSRVD